MKKVLFALFLALALLTSVNVLLPVSAVQACGAGSDRC
jgi:hypothetical protein